MSHLLPSLHPSPPFSTLSTSPFNPPPALSLALDVSHGRLRPRYLGSAPSGPAGQLMPSLHGCGLAAPAAQLWFSTSEASERPPRFAPFTTPRPFNERQRDNLPRFLNPQFSTSGPQSWTGFIHCLCLALPMDVVTVCRNGILMGTLGVIAG